MVVNEQQIMLWLGHFLWPFLRITGLFLTAPVFGSALIPPLVKSILAAAFAAALAGWLPNLPAYPADPFTAIYAGVTQIAFGALLGMAAQIIVQSVAGAGEIIGLSMSLSFAELQTRDSSGATPVMYDIMLWAGLLGFLAANGPIWLFDALAQSFSNGVGLAPLSSWADLTGLGQILFDSALRLALPVLAVALCVNLITGIATIFAPQMNLLSIGFPMLILTGLWMLPDTLLFLPRLMHSLMNTGMSAIATMTHG